MQRRYIAYISSLESEVGLEKPQSPIQLNMSFTGENPFAERLRDGKFLILFEYSPPMQEQPFESAITFGAAIARRVRNVPEISGMAVADRLKGENTHDPVEVAAALAEASEKAPLLHISGKGSSPARVRELLARAGSNGIRNILAVTGDRSDQHLFREGSASIPSYKNGYLDSVDTLRLSQGAGRKFFAGAVVNPLKYNPADQYLQYYKMMRKLGSGAEFLIAQAGWDMKKLQELQWYMQMRGVDNPVIARLMLLSTDDISAIHDDPFPGVPIARSFAAMLQRESTISATQSLAAQLQRIGLQVAGCKLLGYSGVQIAGIRDVQTIDMVLDRIREALETYHDYADWLAAWNDFHNFMQFDPIPNAYYVFSGLMQPDQQRYEAEKCQLTEQLLPSPSMADRCRAVLKPPLLSEKLPGLMVDMARRLIFPRSKLPVKLLQYCQYLSPSACPKNLVYGPCGGSRPDGTCEFGHGPCFFHRVLALASFRKELDSLEEGIAHD